MNNPIPFTKTKHLGVRSFSIGRRYWSKNIVFYNGKVDREGFSMAAYIRGLDHQRIPHWWQTDNYASKEIWEFELKKYRELSERVADKYLDDLFREWKH